MTVIQYATGPSLNTQEDSIQAKLLIWLRL